MYVPVWTFEEIEQLYLNTSTPINEDQLSERFKIFGGIPRFLFAKDDQLVSYQSELDAAIAGTSVSDLQNTVHGLEFDEKASHNVFHLAEVPTEGKLAFSTFKVIMASPYVDREVDNNLVLKKYDKLRAWVVMTKEFLHYNHSEVISWKSLFMLIFLREEPFASAALA